MLCPMHSLVGGSVFGKFWVGSIGFSLCMVPMGRVLCTRRVAPKFFGHLKQVKLLHHAYLMNSVKFHCPLSIVQLWPYYKHLIYLIPRDEFGIYSPCSALKLSPWLGYLDHPHDILYVEQDSARKNKPGTHFSL